MVLAGSRGEPVKVPGTFLLDLNCESRSTGGLEATANLFVLLVEVWLTDDVLGLDMSCEIRGRELLEIPVVLFDFSGMWERLEPVPNTFDLLVEMHGRDWLGAVTDLLCFFVDDGRAFPQSLSCTALVPSYMLRLSVPGRPLPFMSLRSGTKAAMAIASRSNDPLPILASRWASRSISSACDAAYNWWCFSTSIWKYTQNYRKKGMKMITKMTKHVLHTVTKHVLHTVTKHVLHTVTTSFSHHNLISSESRDQFCPGKPEISKKSWGTSRTP